MIGELRSGTSVMLGRRLAVLPEAEHRRTTEYKIFTYEGLISRAEAEIAWGRRGLELIDSLDQDS
jgi:hypothetical protein